MASAPHGLQTHIWNNNLRSLGLLALYPVILGGIIWACAFAAGLLNSPSNDMENARLFAGGIIAAYWPVILSIVLIWFMVSWFFHGRMIRSMSHSHPVTRKEEPELYNLFENLCISVGLPMPKLEIIESHARNAFASGINNKSYCVTVTRGLLQSLSKDEVEAVLAHELTHILNRDVRLLMVCVIFTGMIGFAAQMLWSNVRYSLWVPRSGSGDKKSGGFLLLLAIALILWVGYFATLFMRFAISRGREYMADAGSVRITKNPAAMMRALARIAGMDAIPKMPGDIQMMCIENRVPFMGLFATHPPIEKRIRILSETTHTPIPDIRPKIRAAGPERFNRPRTARENWTTRERFKARRKNPWG
ncbi:MAG: M48 family metallopeptidase [Rhodospirillales bacterium]|nr:M48 family metallopeptidase [Alphaproteobacteria bacterium]USO03941.1 MAG: M48 family metallopeptidase [Rhodospirillales bacterium]